MGVGRQESRCQVRRAAVFEKKGARPAVLQMPRVRRKREEAPDWDGGDGEQGSREGMGRKEE